MLQPNYIRKRARGRDNYVDPRYKIKLWNQYQAVKDGTSRTNNPSEGWHTRYATLLGKSHPGFYSFLRVLKTEQGNTENALRQLRLGEQVRKPRSFMQRQKERRIRNIVERYETYVAEDDEIGYLETISHYIHF